MNRPGLLARYKNGNYVVRLYDDGTKIKRTFDDEFRAEFPDSVDLKITDRCDMACPMCHENSLPSGRHGDLSLPILSTFVKGTEVAVGGGDPLSHPDLDGFLERMKDLGAVCNLTVNERHFLKNPERLSDLLSRRLIRGLGISVSEFSEQTELFARTHPAAVLHLICGILDETLAQRLEGRGLKILLLGYKDFGRGKAYRSPETEKRIAWLKESIADFSDKFSIVSFDNLAIEQLELKKLLPRSLFEERYMGDDGTASMYIDLVKEQCAASSVSQTRYPLSDTVKACFDKVRKK